MPDFRVSSLGDRLVEQKVITPDELKLALDEQKKTGEPLDRVLIRREAASEDAVLHFIADELSIPFVKIDRYAVDSHIVDVVPEVIARRHQLIPLFKVGDTLTIAMANPLDVEAVDEVRRRTGLKIERACAPRAAIVRAIDQFYASTESLGEVVAEILGEEGIPAPGGAAVEEAPVVRLVDEIISRAVRNKASDIHIEPEERILRIRYRIDGLLSEVMTPPKILEAPIVSRIKVMARLDITEKRLPQDGRIEVTVGDKAIDLRVSVVPTIFGEKIVMRILDKTVALFRLEQLGFAEAALARFRELIKKIPGIILVTGPTGSGKTTTLYAALNEINSIDRNIITIEDPVEYHIEGVNQIQVNSKVGFDFANGLRSILRQDPDIIMVGEIRDLESAEIAVQASLTGHLVFSTIHTNNAAGAITRWIDMGVRPFLIASTLTGVLAQRLVRVICPHCKETYAPPAELLQGLEAIGRGITCYRGKGCRNCNNSGYSGRIGIFELLLMDDNLRRLTVAEATSDEIEKAAREVGMRSMREEGIDKVLAGITTPEEVLRVIRED